MLNKYKWTNQIKTSLVRFYKTEGIKKTSGLVHLMNVPASMMLWALGRN